MLDTKLAASPAYGATAPCAGAAQACSHAPPKELWPSPRAHYIQFLGKPRTALQLRHWLHHKAAGCRPRKHLLKTGHNIQVTLISILPGCLARQPRIVISPSLRQQLGPVPTGKLTLVIHSTVVAFGHPASVCTGASPGACLGKLRLLRSGRLRRRGRAGPGPRRCHRGAVVLGGTHLHHPWPRSAGPHPQQPPHASAATLLTPCNLEVVVTHTARMQNSLSKPPRSFACD